jgi:glycosyltransferase involved in cell wall biosynthesis
VSEERIPILYLAPWVDFGGSDKGTIDWFRWLDRARFAPSLITTQPSPNRRLDEISPYAEEVWALPDLLPGKRFVELIVAFIVSRGIEVLHVMNSRLGFDLLADVKTLERPPKVVVQLHVEEDTRDGYVRYVTTRYGNLVDAFSVSSRHLADAIHDDYGVSRDRLAVIPTGVDAEREFSPEYVAPRSGLEPGLVHILYPGRLAPQKDPLMMVEVARELRDRGLGFQIHAVGDGELEAAVREGVTAHGLSDHVRLEPPTHELAPWYRAADLMLMTSTFEGVPYVIYEALAMGVPVVAPALAGNVELIGPPGDEIGGALVSERERPAAYADALAPLVADAALRRRTGEAGRRRALTGFPLREMAERHGELYERLAAARPRDGRAPGTEEPPTGTDGSPPEESSPAPEESPPAPEESPPAPEESPPAPEESPPAPARISFPDRPSRGTPLVSVITPCFNHGRLLLECIESVRAQTYPSVEMIIVDDGSTESETLGILHELQTAADLQVVRLERNLGPSAARNRGLERASGRYILPVDSDNLLFERSVELLVAQLQGAGEQVGYIYPVIQYFGNREDLFEPPRFNLWLLAKENYIDTCALIDRTVFDQGIRYAEDIVLGHEDWDFYLTLAARGVVGEPAGAPTLRYRKRGFTRSDLVNTSGERFPTEIRRRHPALFGSLDRVKARWSPALTIVALAPVELRAPEWERVRAGVARQRFTDFELLVASDRDPPDEGLGPRIAALPRRLRGQPGEAVVHALELTASPLVALTYGTGEELLSDPGSVEKLARILEHGSGSGLVALADRPAPGRYPWAPIPGDEPGLEPDTFAWARHARVLRKLPAALDSGDPIGDLARWRQLQRISIDWRHLPAPGTRSGASTGTRSGAPTGMRSGAPTGRRLPLVDVPRPRAELSDRHSRLEAEVRLASAGRAVPRWADLKEWVPPGTSRVFRHRRTGASEWVLTRHRSPSDGFECERELGAIHNMSLEGTARIVSDPGQGWRTVERGTSPGAEEMEHTLGYADQVPFPLLDALLVCRHAASGRPLPLCGEDDPWRAAVEWPPLAVLGWIDRIPINPQSAPRPGETMSWLRGLVRSVDHGARRHRVALGEVPPGEGVEEIGALVDRDPGDGIPVWIEDGRLRTAEYVPAPHPFSPRRVLHWTTAPTGWRELAGPRDLAKAIARRSVEAARGAVAGRAAAAMPPAGPPHAWLLRDAGPHRIAIISAVHPVTHDQLVSRDSSEVRELGYESPRIVGYALRVSPVTGSLGRGAAAVPWAEHFGLRVSRAEDPVPAGA